jgi:precorrin-3B methylase
MNIDVSRSHEIAIVGLGMAGTHQITREVEETIRRSRHLFITDMASGVVDYLRTLCPQVTDLTKQQKFSGHRIVLYRKMAREVVASAMEEAPVCFASYGHPKMYCYPTTLIQRAAQLLNLRTVVLPGVSSLDTLLTDLGIDPGVDGLQIYEASDALIRNRPLQSDVGCVIYQAPIVLEPNNRLPGKNARENLRVFQEYLLKFYPPQHTALFVTTKNHPLLETITQRVPVGQIADRLLVNSTMGTLYIPAVRHREVANAHLAKAMTLVEEKEEALPPRRPGRPEVGPRPPKR